MRTQAPEPRRTRRSSAEPADLSWPPKIGPATVAGDLARGVFQRAAMEAMALLGEPLPRLMSRRVQRDPYPFYAELRDRGPIIRGRRVPISATTTHELCYGVTRDPRFGVDNRILNDHVEETFAPGDPRAILPSDNEMILRMDPPDHTRVRKLVSKAFTPRAIERLRPRVQQVADELLDAAVPAGRMDLITEFATQLPIIVICEILGVPTADRQQFRHWGDDAVATIGLNHTRAQERRAQAASYQLALYFENLFEARRADPGDDILSALLAAEDEGARLSHRELLGTCMLLLLAGFETTVNLIGNGTAALLRNPDQLALLRDDPALAANATEELLRFDSPVQFTSRNVIEDTELAGVEVKQGEQIIVMIGAANRDPSVFAEPDRLDLTRSNAGDHVGFSSGPHFCLGAALARIEGQVAFTSLPSRCPNLRADGFATRGTNELLRGYKHLPVAFDAA